MLSQRYAPRCGRDLTHVCGCRCSSHSDEPEPRRGHEGRDAGARGSARGRRPGRRCCCARPFDRIDHHQGHHNLAGLVQVGQFLNSTRALARGGSNTSFVVIDWKECLPLHPAHAVVWTPASIDTRAAWSPNDFRFVLYVAFLRAFPQVRRLMICDGRDTLLSIDPVPRLAAHALYADVAGGCGNRARAAPPRCQAFLQKCQRGYLNAGLLGGDRDLVQGVVEDVVAFLEACEVEGDCRGGNKVPNHNLNMIAVNCVVAQRQSNGSLDLRTGRPFQGVWVDHDRRWALDRRGERNLHLDLDADLRAVNATWAHEVVARSFFDPAAHQRRLTACPDAAALRRAAVPPLGVLARAARGRPGRSSTPSTTIASRTPSTWTRWSGCTTSRRSARCGRSQRCRAALSPMGRPGPASGRPTPNGWRRNVRRASSSSGAPIEHGGLSHRTASWRSCTSRTV